MYVSFCSLLIGIHRNIIPWVKKHKVNPVTGGHIKQGDLVTLKFEKNADGVTPLLIPG